jgi:outer membrane protein, heavy metal efflux system
MPHLVLFRALAGRACLSIAVLFPAWAGASVPLSLADAVRVATDSAPGLAAQDAVVAAAQAEARRAGALPDPMLSVGVDNLPVTGGQAFDPNVDDMTMKRIGVRQEFPAAAKRNARVAVAGRRVDEARVGVVAARLAVQRAAAEAWIAAWSAMRLRQALQAQQAQAQLAAQLARARAGAGGPLDAALAAAAAVSQLEQELAQVRGEEGAARARLGRWVPDADTRELLGAPPLDRLPVPPHVLLARLDELGPLLASQARVETAAAEVDEARADKRPDWSLMAAYGQRGRERSDMLSVELAIALPIFPGARQDQGVFAREADYRQALALREDARRALRAELGAMVARWDALHRQMAIYETQWLPLARDRSAAALAAYRAGGALQPWLDARAAELDTERLHAAHLDELAQAWAALAYLLPEPTP